MEEKPRKKFNFAFDGRLTLIFRQCDLFLIFFTLDGLNLFSLSKTKILCLIYDSTTFVVFCCILLNLYHII